MREECKFFQVRTYPSGDVSRFCALGLAPEAPWRCPQDCPRYEKRLNDAGFARGSQETSLEPSPEPELDPNMVRLLGTAAEIISAAGPEIRAEQERQRREREEAERRWWNKLRQSPRWRR